MKLAKVKAVAGDKRTFLPLLPAAGAGTNSPRSPKSDGNWARTACGFLDSSSSWAYCSIAFAASFCALASSLKLDWRWWSALTTCTMHGEQPESAYTERVFVCRDEPRRDGDGEAGVGRAQVAGRRDARTGESVGQGSEAGEGRTTAFLSAMSKLRRISRGKKGELRRE